MLGAAIDDKSDNGALVIDDCAIVLAAKSHSPRIDVRNRSGVFILNHRHEW